MYGLEGNDPFTKKPGKGEATFETKAQAEKVIWLIKTELYKKELKKIWDFMVRQNINL